MVIDTPTHALGWPRWALILFGIVSIMAGVLALIWPEVTILALVIILGINILVWGVMVIVNAFQAGQGRVLAVVFGALALIAGTALFLRPVRNLPAVMIVLSVFWVVGGLIESIGSVVDRGPSWGWELASGLASIAAGIIAIIWPGITLFVVAIVAGVWMIVIGFVRLIAAFTGRAGARTPPPAVAV
jgi:uncharacterized membrane protein HdeD (DUF308 family)